MLKMQNSPPPPPFELVSPGFVKENDDPSSEIKGKISISYLPPPSEAFRHQA